MWDLIIILIKTSIFRLSCYFMFLMVEAVSLPFYGGRGQLTVAVSLLIDGGS